MHSATKLEEKTRCLNATCVASIIISTRIGHLYDEMGYPGKAALEFAQAKAAIANMACSNEAEIYYIIFYSLHLANRGKLDDA